MAGPEPSGLDILLTIQPLATVPGARLRIRGSPAIQQQPGAAVVLRHGTATGMVVASRQ